MEGLNSTPYPSTSDLLYDPASNANVVPLLDTLYCSVIGPLSEDSCRKEDKDSKLPSTSDSLYCSVVGPIIQEFLAVLVFAFSFTFWRHLQQRQKSNRRKGGPQVPGSPSNPSDLSLTSPRPSSNRSSRTNRPVKRDDKAAEPAVRKLLQGPKSDDTNGLSEAAEVEAAEKEMLQSLHRRDFTDALNLFRLVERRYKEATFKEELFSEFVQAAVRVGKLDVFEKMIRFMQSKGMVPSTAFWQDTLRILSTRKNYSACLLAHSIFASPSATAPHGVLPPGNRVIYSCLVNAALEMGKHEEAADLLNEYKASQDEPKDYNIFFRAYRQLGNIEAAIGLFKEIGAESLSTMVLNSLLMACTSTTTSPGSSVLASPVSSACIALRALEVLYEAKATEEKENPIVDVQSCNIVMKALASKEESERVKWGGRATASSNVTSITKLLEDMVSWRLEPDASTLGAVLEAAVAHLSESLVTVAVRVLSSSHRAFDGLKFSMHLRNISKHVSVAQALALYEEMKRRRVAVNDVSVFGVLIKGCIGMRDLDRAMLLVKDMKSLNLKPDDLIYSQLLDGCREANRLQLGQELFQAMLESGVQPSAFTLMAMLKLFGRNGAHDEAYDLVESWERRFGVKPTVLHYTCLLSATTKGRCYDQAWRAYQLMKKAAVRPDGTALATLLSGMVLSQDWSRVVDVAEAALGLGSTAVPRQSLISALEDVQASSASPEVIRKAGSLLRGIGGHHTSRSSASNWRSP
mmetsp:Transcript_6150/g.14278  ORF Transcript_6150/g.14278 Transcript_6150/m.14278 type:complete len:746 (+) Transcript_6150:122-2359(+)|eukprot:CAMPEP_0206434780 /NCGR_PEP_ID=MMETSP0324_2-20121206/9407_1 /ASSEMBLY_ACC=CAM_ASM_000836 /TAXON_ID=2866 /ORGANISM="Crypthecodinium cohnii, Strain Seligo" /LENGTH=745 /DNA_ID=CAMNT_0053901451 /DNA_START=122 /DNA_END=2359 /DNA_ORIENTATION=+